MIQRFLRRLAHLFHRNRFDREIEEEMRLHRDLRAAKLRERGEPEPEIAARRRFGNALLLREESRETWRWRWPVLRSDALAQDVRYALRQCRRNPMFTGVAVATLALGIGANTAIFSLVEQLLLRPAGIDHPERLVAVREKYDNLNLKNISVSPPTFADARDSRQIFEHAAAMRHTGLTYLVHDGLASQDTPEWLVGAAVSAEWFEVFGAKPSLGRVFAAKEDQPGANHVVVLSNAAWIRLFGGDPAVLGRTMELSQEPYKIIGVMAPAFEWPRQTDLWIPLALPPSTLDPRNRFNEDLLAVARTKPGVSPGQVDAWFKILTDRVWNGFPPAARYARSQGWAMFGVPFIEFNSGDARRPVLVLLGAVGMLLLIACSNIAGLMLARTSARALEMGIRAALGAGRTRLWGQILSECLILAMAGGLAAVGLARAGLYLLLKIAPEKAVVGTEARLDPYVLLFTAATAIAASILFGVAPAWQASKVKVENALKDAGRSHTVGRARLRLRSSLVTAEAGLALVLLVAAGQFLRSFARLQSVNPGFDARSVMTAMFSLPPKQYPDAGKQALFYRAVLDRLYNVRLDKTTGVSASAIAAGVPFTPYGDSGAFGIQGKPQSPGEPVRQADRHYVTPDYFKALSIPLRRGRAFAETDNAGSELVALIDDNLARQYWPNEDPIGQRIRPTTGPDFYTVVGIVGHVIGSDLAADSGKGSIYFNLFQMKRPLPVGWIVAKTIQPRPSGRGSPGAASLAGAIRAAVHEADPGQPVRELASLDKLIADSLAPHEFAASLLGLFAILALLMAALGLYGVISYNVAQAKREIGIRMALGASQWWVLSSVVSQGLRLTLLGVAAGFAGSLLLQGALRSQLFETPAFDPLIFASMAAILVAASLAASCLPAFRAVRVDPLRSLHYE
ncbi:MAG TPA: ABC transporter permease [Bryobacteraceae bacterium]